MFVSLPHHHQYTAFPLGENSPKNTPRFDRRRLFFVIFAFIFVATLSFLFTKNPQNSSATLDGFKPGNIINDFTMGNYLSMSEQEIQAWLTAKNPCNNHNYATYEYLTKKYAYKNDPVMYSWHWTGDSSTGHFVCISEELFGDGTTIGSGETAAHIIYQAAQDYRINPQVLLVLLEKEKSLITDAIPRSGQYQAATGYACSDSAPCDTRYAGFKNQIRYAAALFRYTLDGKSSYYPIGNNYIQYNVSSSCGGSTVYIENYATSALYRYTPYQPNAAALRAGTGTGDSCSAYGNRNFYHYFTSWFGSTQTTANFTTGATLPSGVYQLLPESNNAASALASVNGNITLKPKEFILKSQQWNFTYDAATETYTISDAATGKILSGTLDDSIQSNTTLQLRTPNTTCSGKWYIIKTAYGTYNIVSACRFDIAISANHNTNTISTSSVLNSNSSRWHILRIGGDASGNNAKDDTIIAEDTKNTSNNSTANTTTADLAQIVSGSVYEIYSTLNEQSVLDVGGVSNHTNVQTYKSDHSIGQQWKITKNSDGTYQIVNTASGKALDVANASTSSGANVQLYSANSTCAQKWYITSNQDGSFTFNSACNRQLALDVHGYANNGDNVWLFTNNNTKAQQWYIRSSQVSTSNSSTSSTSTAASSNTTNSTTTIDENTTYIILSQLNTKAAIDISTTNNGANVQTYTANHSTGQKWRFKKNSDGTYSIIHQPSGKALDVANASTSSGANVQLYSANSTCAQKWYITSNQDGSFTFNSACNRQLALDVHGYANNGDNVWLFTNNNTKAQQWVLQKI